MQTHHTADHDDVSSFPLLHVRHHLLDHADHPKEIGLKDFLHLFDGDALQWTHQADTCIIDWLGEEEGNINITLGQCRNVWFTTVRMHLLTEDIHMSIFDAVNTLFDRLIAADVQYSQKKSFPVRIPSSFHQLIFTFQITHRGYDCVQVEGKTDTFRGR